MTGQELRDRFDKIDKELESLSLKIDELRLWKASVMGIVAVLSALISLVISYAYSNK